MWGRNEESPSSATAAAAPQAEKPSAPAAARPNPPAAAAARPAQAPAGRGQATVIGKSVQVKGTISGHEDLFVDGEIEGTVDLEDNILSIGPNGSVHADVKAREINVQGKLNGVVRAIEKIEIRKTGSFEGDLASDRIIIEDGAVFRGRMDVTKPQQNGPKIRPVQEKESTPSSSEAPAPAKTGE